MTLTALVLCLLGIVAPLLRADEETEPLKGLGSDAAEIESYKLIAAGQLIDAREAALKILARNPSSFAAEYVIGYELHQAEGDLPLALIHLKHARKLFEDRYGTVPGESDPWRWHVSTLEEMSWVAAEMDHYEDQLAILDARDKAYDPDWVAERGWPLMKLHRYEEARRLIARARKSDRPGQVSQALTALAAVEWELKRRMPAYDASIAALDFDRKRDKVGPVVLTNAAESSISVLRMDEAERLIIEGTKHFEAGTVSNPWSDLLWLYVAEGRTAEALDAARQMFSWQNGQPALMEPQTRTGTEGSSALFLLATGHAVEAARILARIRSRPDRTGYTSGTAETAEAGEALLDRAAARLAAERVAEEASWSGTWNWARAKTVEARLLLRAWSSGRRAATLVAKQDMLASTLRPYVAGAVSAPEWLEGDICEILGPGVVRAALDRARLDEDMPAAAAYLDSFEAECRLLQGDARGSLDVASKTIDALPHAEALLRARVAAVGGQAATLTGDTARATELYSRAMQFDRGVLRRLGFALPCTIDAKGGTVAQTAAGFLRASPRLDQCGWGFRVTVEGGDDAGSACLSGPHGEVLACAHITPRAGESSKDAARRLAAEFHEQAFAPQVDMTQADMRSLDGSTTSTNERNSLRLKSMFAPLTGESESPK